MVMPLIKSGGKALLKEGVRSGANIAQDVLSGRNVKTALKRRANESGQRLFRQVVGGLASTPAKKKKKKRKTAKRRTKDIFD